MSISPKAAENRQGTSTVMDHAHAASNAWSLRQACLFDEIGWSLWMNAHGHACRHPAQGGSSWTKWRDCLPRQPFRFEDSWFGRPAFAVGIPWICSPRSPALWELEGAKR
jgi:hypothetical protein